MGVERARVHHSTPSARASAGGCCGRRPTERRSCTSSSCWVSSGTCGAGSRPRAAARARTRGRRDRRGALPAAAARARGSPERPAARHRGHPGTQGRRARRRGGDRLQPAAHPGSGRRWRSCSAATWSCRWRCSFTGASGWRWGRGSLPWWRASGSPWRGSSRQRAATWPWPSAPGRGRAGAAALAPRPGRAGAVTTFAAIEEAPALLLTERRNPSMPLVWVTALLAVARVLLVGWERVRRNGGEPGA